jgi:hypothetical protein
MITYGEVIFYNVLSHAPICHNESGHKLEHAQAYLHSTGDKPTKEFGSFSSCFEFIINKYGSLYSQNTKQTLLKSRKFNKDTTYFSYFDNL